MTPDSIRALTSTARKHWWWIAALLVAARWTGRGVKRVFVTPPNAAEARATDKARQRQIRRELRGLE